MEAKAQEVEAKANSEAVESTILCVLSTCLRGEVPIPIPGNTIF